VTHSFAPPAAILETALYADDLDAAERFYRDVVGLAVIGKVDGRHVFFRCGGGVLLVFNPEATKIPPPPDARMPVPPHGARGAGHMCFSASAEELEGWRRRLTAHRVEVESEVEWPSGGRSIYARDPAGNSVEWAEPRIWGL
jgi:catechol 2,3-dioxygenase-like lactoylglutathione lyase family enzyme